MIESDESAVHRKQWLNINAAPYTATAFCSKQYNTLVASVLPAPDSPDMIMD
jgi:hypothetical protein